MELYYLCIDFVFQFIVEKYRNKLNQIKSNQYAVHALVLGKTAELLVFKIQWTFIITNSLGQNFVIPGLQKQ